MYGKLVNLRSTTALLAFIVCGNAFAFISPPYGWYAEGFIGATKITNSNTPGNSSTSGIGGGVDVGFKFMPYFAAELGFIRFANSTIRDQFGNNAGTAKRYTYYLTTKGILPVYDTGLEMFGKLGVQRINNRISVSNTTFANNIGLTNSNHSSNGVFLGLGVQYYFMPEFSMMAQWNRAQGNNNSTGNADLYSIGISFIFD